MSLHTWKKNEKNKYKHRDTSKGDMEAEMKHNINKNAKYLS